MKPPFSHLPRAQPRAATAGVLHTVAWSKVTTVRILALCSAVRCHLRRGNCSSTALQCGCHHRRRTECPSCHHPFFYFVGCRGCACSEELVLHFSGADRSCLHMLHSVRGNWNDKSGCWGLTL